MTRHRIEPRTTEAALHDVSQAMAVHDNALEWLLRPDAALNPPLAAEGWAFDSTLTELLTAAALAAAVGWGAAHACAAFLGSGTWATASALGAGTLGLAVVFPGLARLLKIAELRSLPGLG